MILTGKNGSAQTETLSITTLLNTKLTCGEKAAPNHMCYGTVQCRLMIDVHAVHIFLEDMSDGPSFFYVK
jgi:hypothetical protein